MKFSNKYQQEREIQEAMHNSLCECTVCGLPVDDDSLNIADENDFPSYVCISCQCRGERSK